MRKKVQSWIQSLQSSAIPLTWVPGASFYTECIKLPEGIESADIEPFLLLELESKAPFPLENLYYGYILDSLSKPQQAFLYASYSERVKSLLLENINDSFYALPSFFPSLPWKHEKAQAHYVLNAKNLSLLIFDAGTALPTKIWSSALPESFSQGELLEAQKELAQRCNTKTHPIAPEVLELSAFSVLEDNSLACLRKDDSPSAPWRVRSTTELWQADLRGISFRDQEIQKRGMDRKLWMGLLSGSGVAALMLLVSLGVGGARLWVSSQEGFLSRQARQVKQIEDNDVLLKRLDKFSSRELRPFKMLDILNSVRPDSLYFVSARAEDLTDLFLEGNAKSVDEVNIYKERLEGSEDLAQVDLDSISSSGDVVRFALHARFKEGFERT